ncbi:MAG: response regulator [Bdellovibrionales bacterium]
MQWVEVMGQIISEHTSFTPLLALIDRVLQEQDTRHLVLIKREYLRPITNEAFMVAIRQILHTADIADVFFASERNIYLAWQGKRDAVFRNLRATVSANLLRQGLTVEPSAVLVYVDLATTGTALRNSIQQEAARIPSDGTETDLPKEQIAIGEEDPDESQTDTDPSSTLKATQEQVRIYKEGSRQKPYRKHLHMLVVEDQLFSQKLLCEILRGVRINNNNESPVIEAVEEMQDAWKLFLKRSHDIVFIDLGLLDGSGHTLARAIKELDPNAQVIIVTANNYEEEQEVARQNNVDAFIAKPFSRKQIIDCIERYISNTRSQSKGTWRGTLP